MQGTFDAVRAQVGGVESTVPSQQLEYMALRLKTIAPRAAVRKINLQYLEHRVSAIIPLMTIKK